MRERAPGADAVEPPSIFNLNALWCSLIADELVRAGVADVVIAPGGRSAAMALTLRAAPQLRTLFQIDERGAAFIALGIARATGRPVAVCTTSGSAVANMTPALVEADASGVPLVLIACDRPRRYHGNGAPQWTDHLGLCRSFVRSALDLEDPSDDQLALRSLRTRLAELLRRCTDPSDRGPVLLNVPLDGVLSSVEIDPSWCVPADVPQATLAPASAVPLRQTAGAISASVGLRPGLKGLIVATGDGGLERDDVAAFASITGYPVVADAASNLRRPAIPNLVTTGDALVLDPRFTADPPEIVIRIGAAPVMHTLHAYLAALRCPVLRIDARPVPRDFLHDEFVLVQNPSGGLVRELAAAASSGDRKWLTRWTAADATARAKAQRFLAGAAWGDCAAAAVVCAAEDFPVFHLSNSMAVRLGNLLCGPRASAQRIFANRGVNGIDGTIASFLGEAIGANGCGLLLIGDQAMLHDLSSLAAVKPSGARGCICVINNGGGALFDLLGSTVPGFHETVRDIPTGVDFGAASAAFGLPFRRVC
ncbi:MAG: 2-succinyl-5-enolpyruvyl-6-hydroxy-3-cyclohexene-1-carboxylic-acid synthase, partial [Candidatus Eremiobacteraeota bacterium]|nr:2-succinyl-5-enolpyruvyl-6-hydroxy-3-cyclohexene-1-carboxylic-acid synthase [Candidatus Eremiobacteraeota bacterium]